MIIIWTPFAMIFAMMKLLNALCPVIQTTLIVFTPVSELKRHVPKVSSPSCEINYFIGPSRVWKKSIEWNPLVPFCMRLWVIGLAENVSLLESYLAFNWSISYRALHAAMQFCHMYEMEFEYFTSNFWVKAHKTCNTFAVTCCVFFNFCWDLVLLKVVETEKK